MVILALLSVVAAGSPCTTEVGLYGCYRPDGRSRTSTGASEWFARAHNFVGHPPSTQSNHPGSLAGAAQYAVYRKNVVSTVGCGLGNAPKSACLTCASSRRTQSPAKRTERQNPKFRRVFDEQTKRVWGQ